MPVMLYTPVTGTHLSILLMTLGQKYYYNRKTNASQWELPNSMNELVPQHADHMGTGHEATVTSASEPSYKKKCMGCGGWGLGLVQAWGYCNHCTRYSSE